MPTQPVPHLHLVDGTGAAPAADEVLIARTAARGERHEPWTLATTEGLRALEREAADLGMDLELALRLVVETGLVADELAALQVEVSVLDCAAGCARVTGAVDAVHAAYVRRLSTTVPRAPRTLDALVIAGLPSRLSNRLLAADLDDLIARGDLARARAWETAAVLAGRTISEWAPLTALALTR